MQERSPSGARAEPERSPNGAEDSERSTRLRKDAQKQGRSPNGARAEPERRKDSERSTGLRKDVRSPETTLFRDRRISFHSWETQCSSSSSDSYESAYSRTCLALKGFTETNRRRYTGQRPGTKSARGPGDQPVVNRGFCSSIGLHRISFVRASEASRTVSSIRWEQEGGLSLGQIDPTASRPVQPRLPSPPRRAPPRPDRPVVCPGFGLDRSIWGPVRSFYARPTPSRGLRRSCLFIR